MTSARLAPDFALGAHTMIAFPTPIVVYRWPDSDALNKALREVILDAEKSDPGLTFSNVGGWHSDTDLFTWPQECIATLRERVQAMALELAKAASDPGRAGATASFGIEAWANVVRSGGYHSAHKHPNYMWSGVYYVAVGIPDAGKPSNGCIEFIDPRDAAGMVSLPGMRFAGRQVIAPEPGMMVVVPSWLKHYVHPFFGKLERISVAFNVVVMDYQTGAPGRQ